MLRQQRCKSFQRIRFDPEKQIAAARVVDPPVAGGRGRAGARQRHDPETRIVSDRFADHPLRAVIRLLDNGQAFEPGIALRPDRTDHPLRVRRDVAADRNDGKQRRFSHLPLPCVFILRSRRLNLCRYRTGPARREHQARFSRRSENGSGPGSSSPASTA